MDYQSESILKNIYIEDTTLSLRVKNALLRAGIRTLWDLSNFYEKDLLSFKNFGKNSINELKNFIKDCEFNISLWNENLNLNHISEPVPYERIRFKDDEDTFSATWKSGIEKNEILEEDEIPNLFFESIDVIEGLSENALIELKKNKIRKIGQLIQVQPEKLFWSEDKYNEIIAHAIENDTCEIPELCNFDNDIKIITNYFKNFNIQYPQNLSAKTNLKLLEYTLEEVLNIGWINIVVEMFSTCLDKIEPKYKSILIERFGIGCEKQTLEILGKKYGGLTRERIRQIEKRSLDKVAKYMRDSGYIDYINKFTKDLFENFGSVYYEKNESSFFTYKPLIERIASKFEFFLDDRCSYIVENKNWFELLKDDILSCIEETSDFTISKNSLLEIICSNLNKILKNKTGAQNENYNKILNDLKDVYLKHYIIKINDNTYKILRASKRSRSGKVKTDDRNDEIVSLFASTFPNGVHLPIDKPYELEKNLKPLTDKIPYDISIRTLSDGILKNAKQIILWDRGIYRHVNTIQIQWSAVNNAIDEIITKFDAGISIFSIKKIYDNNIELYVNAGIPNSTALLGLVKYKENPRIGNSKLEVFDINNEGDSINKTEIIEQYLLECGDWVPITEMQNHFCDELGWENYQVEQYVYSSDKAKKDTKLGYIHADILRKRINKEALNVLLQQLYRQVKFTNEPMKLENVRKSSFSRTWYFILNADVSGNFMSDFIDSLITANNYPLIFYQGYAYSADYRSEELIARLNIEDIIKNFEERNYKEIYNEFECFDKKLLDKITRSHIKIANVLIDKNLQDICNYFYDNNISDLAALLFFPFNCIEFKKMFTDAQIKKIITKVCSWVESFEDSEDQRAVSPDIASIFWRE